RDFSRYCPEITVRNRRECACPSLRDSALGIIDRKVRVRITKVRASVVYTVPLRVPRALIKRSDNVRDSGAVCKASECRNAGGSAAGQVKNHPGLPSLDSARHPAGGIAEEQLVRTHGQLNNSIRAPVVRQRAEGPSIVGATIQGVCNTRPRKAQRLRPCVGSLHAKPMGGAQCELRLHGMVIGTLGIRSVVCAGCCARYLQLRI